MSRLLQSSCCTLILLSATFTCTLPARSDDKPADKPANKYTETGSVLSTMNEHGHFYQVSTDSRIYLLFCDHVKTFQFGSPECKVGDKPIAAGDTIHFRLEGDWAYMPPISKAKPQATTELAPADPDATEQKLRILTTELKVIPPLPPSASTPGSTPAATASNPATATKPGNASNSANASNAANQRGMVIGSGLHMKGQPGVGWSTIPAAASPITTASGATPVMPSGPVMATPVTGGPPVMITPTGPVTGGVVTGVPVTGGAPITAIPTAPVMGPPVASAHPAGGGMVIGGGGAPQWVHVLRIQTAGDIYQLECSTKPCKLAGKEIALGDVLTLRTDRKNRHAYLATDPPTPGGEEEYKILSITVANSPANSKPADSKPGEPKPSASKPE